MAITSLDILNLSHSLKDVCEVNCNTPACLNLTLKYLMQYNLLQANLEFSRQFDCTQAGNAPETAVSRPTPPLAEPECTGLDISNPLRPERRFPDNGTSPRP